VPEILVPTSTATVDLDWTLIGAPSAHEALDEGVLTSDDGATQLRDLNGSPIVDPFPPSPVMLSKRARVEVGLAAPLENPEPSDTHTLRIRWRLTSGAWPAGVNTDGLVGLYLGDSLMIANRVRDFILDPGGLTVWQTSEFILSGAESAMLAGNYGNLRIEFQTGALGAYFFRVSAVELQVPDPTPGIVPDPALLRLAAVAPSLEYLGHFPVRGLLRFVPQAPKIQTPFVVSGQMGYPLAVGGRTLRALSCPSPVGAPVAGGRVLAALEVSGQVGAVDAGGQALVTYAVDGGTSGPEVGGRASTSLEVPGQTGGVDAGGRIGEDLNL